MLKAIGISGGYEVIVPTQTFVSTASCVVNNGGTPIFCEIDHNHLIDFDDLKAKITANTKAIIIGTEWNEFRALDFNKIKENTKNLVIFDLRNIYNAKDFIELGFEYYGTGK